MAHTHIVHHMGRVQRKKNECLCLLLLRCTPYLDSNSSLVRLGYIVNLPSRPSSQTHVDPEGRIDSYRPTHSQPCLVDWKVLCTSTQTLPRATLTEGFCRQTHTHRHIENGLAERMGDTLVPRIDSALARYCAPLARISRGRKWGIAIKVVLRAVNWKKNNIIGR